MILKLKRTPGIYLAGFMGSGKSTVGRLLAERLGWHFSDLDEDIESDQGVTISEIFDTRGEAEFRRIESDAIRKRVREIERGKPTVIALGGGTFVEPRNAELLGNNGITIWLDCSLDRIRARVDLHANRPLARDPRRFEKLYEERRAGYAKADYRIEITGDDPAAAVEAVLSLPLFR